VQEERGEGCRTREGADDSERGRDAHQSPRLPPCLPPDLPLDWPPGVLHTKWLFSESNLVRIVVATMGK